MKIQEKVQTQIYIYFILEYDNSIFQFLKKKRKYKFETQIYAYIQKKDPHSVATFLSPSGGGDEGERERERERRIGIAIGPDLGDNATIHSKGVGIRAGRGDWSKPGPEIRYKLREEMAVSLSCSQGPRSDRRTEGRKEGRKERKLVGEIE